MQQAEKVFQECAWLAEKDVSRYWRPAPIRSYERDAGVKKPEASMQI